MRFGLEPVESEPTEECRGGLLGWKGKGLPSRVQTMGRSRAFHDGEVGALRADGHDSVAVFPEKSEAVYSWS